MEVVRSPDCRPFRREFFMVFAFMGLGLPEILIVLVIVVLIFGASRLPELGKGLGKGIRNFKDATKEAGKPDA
jgi:sec-independent protein translocase protein TatA